MANKVKGNVIRQGDFHLVKTLLHNRPRIGLVSAIILLGKGGQRMRNDDEVKGLFLTNGDDFLELAQRCAVLAEIVAELVPDKNKLDIIFIDDIRNPIPQGICGKVESCNTLFCGKTENIVYQR